MIKQILTFTLALSSIQVNAETLLTVLNCNVDAIRSTYNKDTGRLSNHYTSYAAYIYDNKVVYRNASFNGSLTFLKATQKSYSLEDTLSGQKYYVNLYVLENQLSAFNNCVAKNNINTCIQKSSYNVFKVFYKEGSTQGEIIKATAKSYSPATGDFDYPNLGSSPASTNTIECSKNQNSRNVTYRD